MCNKSDVSAGLLLLFFSWIISFDLEDGGDTLFRNIGELLPNYTALQSREVVLFTSKLTK
jgi:hypothetical protein